METKHTLGPWKVAKHTLGPWKVVQHGYDSNSFTITAPTKTLGDREITTANARLIAAAPELLEALQKIVVVYHKDKYEPPIINAKQAIAKATE